MTKVINQWTTMTLETRPLKMLTELLFVGCSSKTDFKTFENTFYFIFLFFVIFVVFKYYKLCLYWFQSKVSKSNAVACKIASP